MSNHLIARLGIVFDPPSVPNVPAYYGEVEKLLAKYSHDELDRAADLIIRTRKYKTFPAPAECVSACEDIRGATRARHTPPPEPTPHLDWTKARLVNATAMMKCAAGRAAARDGYALQFHDYCRKHQRLPEPDEIGDMKARAEHMAACARGEIKMGICHAALQSLAQSMLQRGARIGRHILEAAQ